MIRSRFLLTGYLVLCLSACSLRLSNHATTPADIGSVANAEELEKALHRPGILSFEKIHTLTMVSTRGEQIVVPENVADEKQLVEGYFYAIRHPERGLFLVDAGLPSNFEDKLNFIARQAIKDQQVTFHTFTDKWLENSETPAGVFLTHLHFDHMMGVSALASDIPIYVGPEDGTQKDLLSLLASPTDAALSGRAPLLELQFHSTHDQPYGKMIDVFGDGSFWAFHTPGHSPGSLAYLANTTTGPQLITGDAVRLSQEWNHGLQAAYDEAETAPITKLDRSRLKALVSRFPEITIHIGHGELEES